MKNYFTKAIVCAGVMASALALSSMCVFADVTDITYVTSVDDSPISGTVSGTTSTLSQSWVYPGYESYENVTGTYFDVVANNATTKAKDYCKNGGSMFDGASNAEGNYGHGVYLSESTDTLTINVKNTGTLILDYANDGSNRYANIAYNGTTYTTGKTGKNDKGIQAYFDVPEAGTYTISMGDRSVYFYAIGFIQKEVAPTYSATWDLDTSNMLAKYDGNAGYIPNSTYDIDLYADGTTGKVESRPSNSDTQLNQGGYIRIPVYSTDDKLTVEFRSLNKQTPTIGASSTEVTTTNVIYKVTAADVTNGYVQVTNPSTNSKGCYLSSIKLVTTHELEERTAPNFEYVESVTNGDNTYIVGKVTDTSMDKVGFGASSRAKANAYNNITISGVNFNTDTVYKTVTIGDNTYTSSGNEYYVAFELSDATTANLYVAPYTSSGDTTVKGLGVDATPAA